jgi:hypothetical protein
VVHLLQNKLRESMMPMSSVMSASVVSTTVMSTSEVRRAAVVTAVIVVGNASSEAVVKDAIVEAAIVEAAIVEAVVQTVAETVIMTPSMADVADSINTSTHVLVIKLIDLIDPRINIASHSASSPVNDTLGQKANSLIGS